MLNYLTKFKIYREVILMKVVGDILMKHKS